MLFLRYSTKSLSRSTRAVKGGTADFGKYFLALQLCRINKLCYRASTFLGFFLLEAGVNPGINKASSARRSSPSRFFVELCSDARLLPPRSFASAEFAYCLF